jgi:hypothetical protein
MKNIIVTFFALFVAGCSTAPRPTLNSDQLKTGGYAFMALNIEGFTCNGAMLARKIESTNPLKFDDKGGGLLMFSSRVTLNPLQMLKQDSDAKPSYLVAGQYGIVSASCVVHNGNTKTTYTIGNGGTGTIATFDVKSGEVLDLGLLKMTAAYKGFLFTRRFSHISSRSVTPNNEGTLEVFKEKNRSFASNITTRNMIPTPVAPRPESEPQ